MSDDFLNDYFKRKKKRVIKGSLIFISLFLFIILVNALSNFNKSFFAKISINEIILNNEQYLSALESIKENSNVKGLLVSINSPGGTVVSSQELFQKLSIVSEKIPVVVSMKEVAASGGYLVSLAANKIYSYPGTITGSIGVILQSANIKKLLEKLGVEPVIFKSGKMKASPNPLEDTSEENKESIRLVIKEMHSQFIDLVIKERNLNNKDDLKKIADGRIFTGTQAKNLNLIDEIGTEDDAINWLKSETNITSDISVIDFNTKENFKNFLNLFSIKKLFSGNYTQTSGIFAIWTPYYE
tara:strand:+ start:408 stop:1304 length:897 start_codon:yes stop_codon:yes gene_type:complete